MADAFKFEKSARIEEAVLRRETVRKHLETIKFRLYP